MKRVLWLAQGTDGSEILAYRRRPKRIVTKGKKAGPCGCNEDCTYVYGWDEADTHGFLGDSFTTFCESGLGNAGIKIRPGQLLKLTINVEKK